jgi:hypothetical protein
LERLIFYAWDGLFEVYDEVFVTITPVNDPPGPVQILEPKDGKNIKNGETLDFKAKCSDPDLPYGDVLTITWVSDISGTLGKGEVLYDIRLPEGQHRITLIVSDNGKERIRTSISVNVEARSGIEDSKSNLITIGLLGLGILIILIIIIIIFLRKKKQYSQKIFGKPEKDTISEKRVKTSTRFQSEKKAQDQIEVPEELENELEIKTYNLDVEDLEQENQE